MKCFTEQLFHVKYSQKKKKCNLYTTWLLLSVFVSCTVKTKLHSFFLFQMKEKAYLGSYKLVQARKQPLCFRKHHNHRKMSI